MIELSASLTIGLIGGFDPQVVAHVLFLWLWVSCFRLRFFDFSGLDAQLNN